MGATFRPDRSAIRPLMEDAMGRRRLAILALLVLVVSLPAPVAAQTKDDTLVYAIQSDMQNWDPPNSVLRESIILGYHVFDHLAARDLKTGKVGPSLATAWRNLDDTTWEVRLRPGVRFLDDHTVRFKTDGPYPLFVERMTALVMHSEKVIKEKGHEWMQENPIGTGPYKLVRWTKKQEHLLVRNDDYWGPKPAFKYASGSSRSKRRSLPS